jgi:Rod binding domain-containing protein
MAGTIDAAGAPPGPVRAASTLSAEQIAKTRKAAQDFEAMALGEMLKPMFATVDTSKGRFGGGPGEAMWQPMLVEEMAKSIAKSGGIGLADSVMKELLRMQEQKHD